VSDCSADLQARIVQARAAGETLTLRGSGSYADYLPAAGGEHLDISCHRGVVSYDPGELVITVRAGTPLLEIDALLAQHNQRLGGECPHLSQEATIGGAIAMGLSGASRPFSGALRDFVLGVRMINGLGEILSFGGQVIKNVAGYDVARLLTGSGGRLGLILEVSLRVLPEPEQHFYRAIKMSSLPEAVRFTNELLSAAEPVTGASFHQGRLHLRFSGRSTTMGRLRSSLGGDSEGPAWWEDLRRWDMPWGRPGWRSYRNHCAAQARTAGNWLSDWNGELIWSAEPEPTADSTRSLQPLGLAVGPAAAIEQRLVAAFDPDGIFGSGRAV